MLSVIDKEDHERMRKLACVCIFVLGLCWAETHTAHVHLWAGSKTPDLIPTHVFLTPRFRRCTNTFTYSDAFPSPSTPGATSCFCRSRSVFDTSSAIPMSITYFHSNPFFEIATLMFREKSLERKSFSRDVKGRTLNYPQDTL